MTTGPGRTSTLTNTQTDTQTKTTSDTKDGKKGHYDGC